MTVRDTEPSTTRKELPEKRETPAGVLYRPQPAGLQVVYLVLLFAASAAVAWGTAWGLGLSESARTLLFVPFFAILFLGYGLWAARLQALAFETLGRGLLRTLWNLIVRRRKPESLEDVLPTPDQLERMAVRAQKAASSFCLMSFPVAAAAGAITAFADADAALATRVAVVIAACLSWGALLSFLARRGYLPILEGE